jgi:hypothetical protein
LAVDRFRFLGLAFAAADVLFEVDEQGVIQFVAGAEAAITGRAWRGGCRACSARLWSRAPTPWPSSPTSRPAG